MIIQTLVGIIDSQGRVLFGIKGRKLGHGQRMWPGGTLLQHDRSIPACAAREVQEEVKLIIWNLQPRGLLDCYWSGNPRQHHRVHIFTTHSFYCPHGAPQATPEMLDPRFFAPEEIPWEELWPSDRRWMPQVLAGESVQLEFNY